MWIESNGKTLCDDCFQREHKVHGQWEQVDDDEDVCEDCGIEIHHIEPDLYQSANDFRDQQELGEDRGK